ncbi:MAG: hypothetical protein JXN60_02435 [Lentisphaerae bacterium]|nr:hypothetical protein [Lentisphaerota bacterium]
MKTFKFRYVNEIAGAFVLTAVILLVGGILFAGQSQGWFEGKFKVKARFRTNEGSFGLQEGNEVWIMNTIAGRVGKIMPTENGMMETTFIMQNRFKTYVRTDSIANVKKKFGVAGDAFVEISRGIGMPVEDGDIIRCVKDEEIIETAQKMLNELQSIAIPMLREIENLLKHANHIASSLEEERGIAGSILNDGVLAGDVKFAIENLNNTLLESETTFRETQRLVKAAQKNWLFRKHMDKEEPERMSLRMTGGDDCATVKKQSQTRLGNARIENNARLIADAAYNLAACLISDGEYEQAYPYLIEARKEMEASGICIARTYLLESEMRRFQGMKKEAYATAEKALEMLSRSKDADLKAEAHLTLSNIYCDDNQLDKAKTHYSQSGKQLNKTESWSLKAHGARVMARIFSMEDDYAKAARQYDLEAEYLRCAKQFGGMNDALVDAADCYIQNNELGAAAERYFKAGRSLFASGLNDKAMSVMGKALSAARRSNNEDLLAQIALISADAVVGTGTNGNNCN